MPPSEPSILARPVPLSSDSASPHYHAREKPFGNRAIQYAETVSRFGEPLALMTKATAPGVYPVRWEVTRRAARPGHTQ